MMTGSMKIPLPVRRHVEEAVERFNRETLGQSDVRYAARFKGPFLYLDRKDLRASKPDPICRLEYSGDPTHWAFAIYKYSQDRYDPQEWLFPGFDDFDGTLDSALAVGLTAYPPCG